MLIAVVLLAACGGSQPAATEAKPVVESAPAEDPFVTMERFKERMCACTEKACAQAVVKELTTWGNSEAADVKGDADKTRMYDLSMETGDCAKRALDAN
jgi:hypothetical protein